MTYMSREIPNIEISNNRIKYNLDIQETPHIYLGLIS